MQWYRIGSYGRKYIADSGFLIKTAAAWEIRSTGTAVCRIRGNVRRIYHTGLQCAKTREFGRMKWEIHLVFPERKWYNCKEIKEKALTKRALRSELDDLVSFCKGADGGCGVL